MHTSMFPHTVTIYNVSTETDKTNFEDVTTQHITVIHGVLLDAVKAANVRESGLEGADAVDLYIPFDVKAVDGVTNEPKEYIGPVDFWKMEDKSKYWTLSDGGDTFFVKGVVVEPDKDREFIDMAYDDVYTVTKVDEKDFGGLQHFEVGGA